MDIGTKRASEILNRKQSTISRWCRNGKFKTATHDCKGSTWHISEEEVLALKNKLNKKGK